MHTYTTVMACMEYQSPMSKSDSSLWRWRKGYVCECQ